MKLENVIAKLKDGFETPQEREEILKSLTGNHFTQVSITTIKRKQDEMFWEDSINGVKRPFEEFAKETDVTILECIEIEMTELGNIVREIEQRQPLTLETEI